MRRLASAVAATILAGIAVFSAVTPANADANPWDRRPSDFPWGGSPSDWPWGGPTSGSADSPLGP